MSDALTIAFTNVFTNILNFLPSLIAAGLVVLTGAFVARWSSWITVRLLKAVRISKLIHNTPIQKFLEKAEITSNIEQAIGSLIRWLVLLVFFIAAVNILGLTTVSTFLNNILGYIPRVISAALILLVGTLIAGFVESIIKGSLSQVRRSSGRLVSKIGSYLVIIFTFLAAFAELGIAESLINTLFIGFVAMLAIGLGLAFGLGSKDLVAKVLDEWYANLKKDLK